LSRFGARVSIAAGWEYTAGLPRKGAGDGEVVAKGIQLKSEPGRVTAVDRSRLGLLALAGGGLSIALVAFVGLFMWMPDGWLPVIGWAPLMRPVYAWLLPTPAHGLSPSAFRLWFGVLLVAMWLCYLGGVVLLGRMTDAAEKARALRLVVLVSVIAHLALIVMPPLLSEDLFPYALFGRMVSHYGLNPYVTVGDAISADPMWPFSRWRHLTTHYGPTFTWLSAAATLVSGSSVVATAIAFKAMASAFAFLTTWAIWRLARDRGEDGLVPAALFAWNPLAVLETASSGHNEAVMMGLALLGLVYLQRRRLVLGVLLLVAAATVKYVTAAVLALGMVHVVFQQEGWRARLRTAAVLGGVVLAALALLYAPFWAKGGPLDTTIDLLLSRSVVVTGKASPSAGMDVGLPTLLGFAGAVVLALVVAARSDWSAVFVLSSALTLVFVVLVFSWQLPWYVLPPLALAIAGPRTPPNRILLVASMLLGLALMSLHGQLVQGHPVDAP
jgi:hypothetical protein